MTHKEQQDWQELCLKALKEPNPVRQVAMVDELNRMLGKLKKGPHPVPVDEVWPRMQNASHSQTRSRSRQSR